MIEDLGKLDIYADIIGDVLFVGLGSNPKLRFKQLGIIERVAQRHGYMLWATHLRKGMYKLVPKVDHKSKLLDYWRQDKDAETVALDHTYAAFLAGTGRL